MANVTLFDQTGKQAGEKWTSSWSPFCDQEWLCQVVEVREYEQDRASHPTNMCMITDGRRVLVQDRKSEKWPGVTFPGGHVECGESIISSVIREIKEETGLTVSNLELCGIQNWTDPTDHYRYLKFA